MIEQILALLDALDAALGETAAGQHLDLYHLGRSALILHYKQQGVTKDFDILRMRTPLESRAVELFGRGTASARLGLFLETVPQGLPPTPQWFCGRCTLVSGNWRVRDCGGRNLTTWPRPSSRAIGRGTART